VAALAAGRWAVVTFAGLWLALSSIGLVLLYWASTLPLESHITDTSYRTIVSLLIGGAALVPLLVLPVSEQSSAELASASEQLTTKSASIGR
jgi:hypothetical protein